MCMISVSIPPPPDANQLKRQMDHYRNVARDIHNPSGRPPDVPTKPVRPAPATSRIYEDDFS